MQIRLQCATFIFMSGQAGFKGNERGDRLASMATMVGGIAMVHAILNAVMDADRSVFSKLDFTPVSHLLE